MAAYHHGNLRDAILVAAANVIAREGIGALSLRSIATGLGVSHTAFRRHFGDREGLLNALAVQGHRWLAEELRAAQGGEFPDVGVAYVRFALTHPGHFTVMFRPNLVGNHDPELAAARVAAFAPLTAGVRTLYPPDLIAAQVAGWGLAHGIATLALTGNLAAALDTSENDVEALARRALTLLLYAHEEDAESVRHAR
jgi:AcrR family transcriptional regulator